MEKVLKNPVNKFLLWVSMGIIVCLIGITNVFADTYNPSSALQYYEYYQGNTKKETSFNYGSNIILSSPNAVNYPYAMSLILNGSYIQGKTYTLNANVITYFESEYFKFYYPNLNYLIVSASVVNGSQRTLCSLQSITQNESYSIACTFTPNANISNVVLSLVNYDWQNNGYVPFGASDYVKFTNYNMSVYDNSSDILITQNDTIINQNNQTNQELSDLNDSINDDNVDTNDATSFFNNFTDNTHGLSGIISAPINAINAMLSNQCTPLTATWKNKTISLPCGYEMWTKFSTFKEFLNIVLDGLICYRLLLKLFKLVERFKNPNDDRVEVMDL